MGVVTRCPACKTLFRIVPDQLTSSSGWVRCGVCSESFDSTVQRYQVIEPATAVADTGGANTPLRETESSGYDSRPAEEKLTAPDQTSTISHGEPALPVDADPYVSERFSDHLLLAEQSFDAVNGPGFLSADAKTHPQGRATRLMLGVSSLLLAFGLMLQVGVHQRGRLASNFPGFHSLLESMCSHAVCNSAPMHDIDALIVDSSSFVTAPDGAYLLSVTVKNISAGILAIPWVELVLTDAMDQIVVRKVLTPSELGARNDRLSPAGQWTATATLNVVLPTGAEPFTGYRVLIFYP